MPPKNKKEEINPEEQVYAELDEKIGTATDSSQKPNDMPQDETKNPLVIKLEDFIENKQSQTFFDTSIGEKVRQAVDTALKENSLIQKRDRLLHRDRESKITIVIPQQMMSISPGVLVEIFKDAVEELGDTEFYKTFTFKHLCSNYTIYDDLNSAVFRILRKNKAIAR